DPRLADYRDLPDASRRGRRAAFIAEGRLIVGTLLAAPRFRVRSVLGTASALAGLALERSTVPVYVARPETLQRIVGFHFHRGCLAAGERPAELGLDVLLQPHGRRILVALEGVTNPDNVGGVLRNATAFGADGVLLGAEGQGLSAAARAAADVHLRIPIVPGVDSLNVATAAGIALHRLARPEP